MEPNAIAVLCGDLNMLRCFAGSDTDTVTVCTSASNVTLRSRHCRRRALITDPLRDSDQTLADLLQLARDLPDKPVLFYGDDATLRLVSRHRDELAPHFRFLLPPAETVEDMVDKARFAGLAERLNLPVPRTLLSSQVETPEQALNYLELPCVLKPNSHIGWFHSKLILEEGGTPQKALRADNLEEFRRLFTKMKSHGVDFVMQEYIEGGDDCIYSFHAYFSRDHQPLGYYVGKKIRTYPKGSGLSTYVELAHDPQIVQVGLEVLRKLDFVGVVKIDFKKDPRRGKLSLLEINPRFNLWNYLGAVCGVNLPMLAYRDIVGLPCEPQITWRSGVRWLSFMDDLRAFVRGYHHDGDLTWTQYLASLHAHKVHDVFSWSDPLPWAVAVGQASKNYAKRFLPGQRSHTPMMRKGVAK